ncbi:MAG: putative metal-binding motif-containing protein, partial [Polyangiaceae bacterium]|nr:putative metal-binding motif-containing protein [Polyangiaceae bacterium]
MIRGLVTACMIGLACGFLASCGGDNGDAGTSSDPDCASGECGGASGSSGHAGGSAKQVTSGGAAGSGPVEKPAQCETRRDCDDGVFCNGEERCDPDHPDAGEDGCVAAEETPCKGDACDESKAVCVSCIENGDVDGDGVPSAACAEEGEEPDCDDNDPGRHPGRTEICDENHIDEDCDPETFGGPDDRDKDKDGHVNAECCNENDDGDLVCGDDCDDSKSGINPDEPEACNDIDDNCDGIIDGIEQAGDLKEAWYLDRDGDGYGVVSTLTYACAQPEAKKGEQWTNTLGDCLDNPDNPDSPAVNPGAEELCEVSNLTGRHLDENCANGTNEGCACTDDDPPLPCGPFRDEEQQVPFVDEDGEYITEGECRRGQQFCIDGKISPECVGSVGPTTDECNGLDDDCDGQVDINPATGEYLGQSWVLDADGDGHGVPDSLERACDQPSDDHTASDLEDDCDDTNKLVNPQRDEECNGYDDNCDGIVDGVSKDHDLENTYWRDQDGDGVGTSSSTTTTCASEPPAGYATAAGEPDCVDDP